MDLSQKFCDRCSQQRDDNNKLLLLNTQKQDENVKLLFDLSLAKAEHEKEQQIRMQLEKQLTETNAIPEQVNTRTTSARTTQSILVYTMGEEEELIGPAAPFDFRYCSSQHTHARAHVSIALILAGKSKGQNGEERHRLS